MKILTVPDQKLRKKSKKISKVDKKLLNLTNKMKNILNNKNEPKGVGLAAPQVGQLYRIFITNELKSKSIQLFINPKIINHSSDLTLGPNSDEPALEGCLSIPNLYGPVPRYEWIKLEYLFLKETQLIKHTNKFINFEARVIQHEIDHLDGILFTDHILEHNLPIYIDKNRQLVELKNKSILETF
jgi:peptide deformylase